MSTGEPRCSENEQVRFGGRPSEKGHFGTSLAAHPTASVVRGKAARKRACHGRHLAARPIPCQAHLATLPPGSELALYFEPCHHPPSTPSRAPPRREARDESEPSAAFGITVGRTQLRRPRPGAVGHLDPDDAVPGPDRDRDRLPGSTRAGVPDTVAEDLADQQDSRVSARVPRPQYLTDERARGPRTLRPSRKRHGLPDRPPSHQRTRLPGRPRPGKSRGPPGGHRDGRPTRGQTSRQSTPGTGTGTQSSGYPHRSLAPIPVRHASVDPATQRPTTLQGDTHWDREKTAR